MVPMPTDSLKKANPIAANNTLALILLKSGWNKNFSASPALSNDRLNAHKISNSTNNSGITDTYIKNKTGVHIIGLTEDAVITIFDILGRRVKEFAPIADSGMAIWDARYEDGRHAGSGVYIITVKSGGKKIARKLAIVR